MESLVPLIKLLTSRKFFFLECDFKRSVAVLHFGFRRAAPSDVKTAEAVVVLEPLQQHLACLRGEIVVAQIHVLQTSIRGEDRLQDLRDADVAARVRARGFTLRPAVRVACAELIPGEVKVDEATYVFSCFF